MCDCDLLFGKNNLNLNYMKTLRASPMVMGLAFEKNSDMSILSSQLLHMWYVTKLDRHPTEKVVFNASLVKYMFLMTCQFIISFLKYTLEFLNKTK